MDDLISEFISETSASLASLDRELGNLETNPRDAAVLKQIARLMHTIKGTTAFIAMPRLEALATAVERAVAKGSATPQVMQALEQIKGLVEVLAADGEEPAGDDRALIAALSEEPVPAAEVLAPEPQPTFVQVLETEVARHESHALVETAASAGALAPRFADMGAQLLQMAGALVETRNQLLTLMRRGSAGLEVPVRQLTAMINALQKQAGSDIVDRHALARVLVLEAAGQKFAIAQHEVRELVRIGDSAAYKVEMVGNAWLLRLRERLLPLMSLEEMLQMKSIRNAPTRGVVVVMHVGGMDFGVVVDAVQEAEEIVVRPLAEIMGAIEMYHGAALLGDGSIVLQLDTAAVGRVFGARGTAVRLSDGEEQALVEYLMFHAGEGALRAVPLAQVLRLETFDTRTIARMDERNYAITYHGSQMPLVLLPKMHMPRKGKVNVIVIRHEETVFGLVVEHIAEIASAPPMKRLSAREPYYLGTAMLAGDAAGIVDLDYLHSRVMEMA